MIFAPEAPADYAPLAQPYSLTDRPEGPMPGNAFMRRLHERRAKLMK